MQAGKPPDNQRPLHPKSKEQTKMRMAGQPVFHACRDPEPQNARSGEKLPGWPLKYHKQGLILGKKKGLLIGRKDETTPLGQHIVEGSQKPVANIFNKIIRPGKADNYSNDHRNKTLP